MERSRMQAWRFNMWLDYSNEKIILLGEDSVGDGSYGSIRVTSPNWWCGGTSTTPFASYYSHCKDYG